MRKFILIWLTAMVVTGCLGNRIQGDAFGSLQRKAKQALAETCLCGPLTLNEVVGGRFFEVVPRHSRFRIVVGEREFFSQDDWISHHTQLTNRVIQFMATTNHTQAEAVRHIDALEMLFRLPEWSYENIGVSVDLQGPDNTYHGIEQDRVEAQQAFDEIVRMLKPYQAVR